MDSITAARWSMDDPARSELPGSGAVMRRLVIKAGRIAARHHHDFEQFLLVLSGHGRLECEQGGIPLEPGTVLHLPRGAWHSAEFMADTVLVETNLSQ